MRPSSRIRRLLLAAALAGGASACNENAVEPLPASHTEVHYQGGEPPPVDVLWVVDNSGSMEQEQSKLGNNFNAFIQYFLNLDLDFQLAVTTTDTDDPSQSGRFVGNPKILKPTTGNLSGAFTSNVNVGIGGSGDERGLEGARLALSDPLLSGENAGFLREGAILAIIIVSDEEDQSPLAVSDYVNHFLSLKGGDPAKVNLSVIVGDTPNGCTSTDAEADAGHRYKEASGALNGVFGSICADDFGPILDQLGNSIAGLATAFPTTYEPVADSIRVLVDGAEIPRDPLTGWSWNASVHGVVFAPPAVPPECAIIEISYRVADYGGPIEQGNNESPPEQCPAGSAPGVNSLEGGAFACSVNGTPAGADPGVQRLLLAGLLLAAATGLVRRRAL